MFSPNEILHNTYVLKKAYDTLCEEIAAKHSMTRVEVDILAFIAANPQYNTARDVAGYRMIAKSHVSKATDALMARGYLRTEPDRIDRRKIRLYPTEAASKIIAMILRQTECFAEEVVCGFTEEEKELMLRLSVRIAENARNMIKDQT